MDEEIVVYVHTMELFCGLKEQNCEIWKKMDVHKDHHYKQNTSESSLFVCRIYDFSNSYFITIISLLLLPIVNTCYFPDTISKTLHPSSQILYNISGLF